MDVSRVRDVRTGSVHPNACIDPVELARARAEVNQILEAGGTIEDLGVHRYAPVPGTAFAFVAPTPKLPQGAHHDRSLWRRCSYCETDRKFMDGKIVLCADGHRRLIGPDCWHEHIGENDWRAAKEEWTAYQRRQKFEKLKGQLAPAIKVVVAEIRKVRAELVEIFAFSDEFPSLLTLRMPDLDRCLKMAMRDGNSLFVERMVQNFNELEGGAGYRFSQEREERELAYRSQAVTVHTLTDTDALRPAIGIPWKMESALLHLHRATHKLGNTDWEASSNIAFKRDAAAVEDECRSAIAEVDRAIDRLRKVVGFLSSRNIRGIVRWANDTDCALHLCDTSGTYSQISGGIRYTPDSGDAVEIKLPAPFGVPRLPNLEKLRELLK